MGVLGRGGDRFILGGVFPVGFAMKHIVGDNRLGKEGGWRGVLCPPVFRAGVHRLHQVGFGGKWYGRKCGGMIVLAELMAVSGLVRP